LISNFQYCLKEMLFN